MGPEEHCSWRTHIRLFLVYLQHVTLSNTAHCTTCLATSFHKSTNLLIPDKETKTGKPVQAVNTKEFYLIDGLRANILIGIDIIYLEKAIIDLRDKLMTLGNCGVVVPVRVLPHTGTSKQFQLIYLKKTVTIPPMSIT
jgi:hypothetical protein